MIVIKVDKNKMPDHNSTAGQMEGRVCVWRCSADRAFERMGAIHKCILCKLKIVKKTNKMSMIERT